jgi:hypothetical protein
MSASGSVYDFMEDENNKLMRMIVELKERTKQLKAELAYTKQELENERCNSGCSFTV